MIAISLDELTKACGGRLVGGPGARLITSVSTDSRKCRGAAFFALKGEHQDGHAFTAGALKGGATCLVISDERALLAGIPALLVPDTLEALQQLSRLVREKSPVRIAALTGSCGKTTTKELTRSILSRACGITPEEVLATSGNFNNDIGVPLTLLELTRHTRLAIVEQGASHIGDIARTNRLVQADAGLITQIGRAHLEGFGSEDGIYRGKCELIEDVLRRGGEAWVPGVEPWHERFLSDFKSAAGAGRLRFFGTVSGTAHALNLVLAKNLPSPEGRFIKLRTEAGLVEANVHLQGAHNGMNAAAACALALALCPDLSRGALQSGLEAARPVGGRLEEHTRGAVTIIDDTYNAGPEAVLAALDYLRERTGERVMIFADMGELGEAAAALHAEVGERAKISVDKLWCLGDLSLHAAEAAGSNGRHFKTREALLEAALALVRERLGKTRALTVLVKGSHAMHMGEIAGALARALTDA